MTGGLGPWLPQSRTARVALAIVLGLVASSLHWGGLLLGGMLVGLLAPTTARGVGYGLGWGLLAWGLFVLRLSLEGILPSMATAQLFGVSLGAAIVLGGLGGSVRELRPLLEAVSPGPDG